MNDLEKRYPEIVESIKVGVSGEGRQLTGVKIGKSAKVKAHGKVGKKGKKTQGKMGFVITGAQHAREVSQTSNHLSRLYLLSLFFQWVATSTSLYLMHALVDNGTAADGSLNSLLDDFVSL